MIIKKCSFISYILTGLTEFYRYNSIPKRIAKKADIKANNKATKI